MPDVPSVAEAALPDFDVVSSTGLGFPAGTPRPIVDKIRTELHRTLKVADVQQRLWQLIANPLRQPARK